MRELEEKKSGRLRTHSVMLDNRERAVFTGVEDVDSFNEEQVNLVTEAGLITLVGQDLHISRLNLDEGQLIVEGYILGMDYVENNSGEKRGGLFSRLFR